MGILERLFQLQERQTTVARELRGASVTFLTMAYILVVNPSILAQAGVPFASAVACTAAAAGISCVLMGVVANFPLALASGMGLNLVVATHITQTTGSWQTAMGVVVMDGAVITLLLPSDIRERTLLAIPVDLRRAIGAGIGLFIAFIGAVNAKLVVSTGIAVPPVTFGSLRNPETAVAMLGLVMTAWLMIRRTPGAILLGIILSSAGAIAWSRLTGDPTFAAEFAQPFDWPDFSNAFQANVLAACAPRFWPLILTLMLVDFFDTLGSVTAVADQARLTSPTGEVPRLRRVLLVDSLSAAIGGIFGASSVTAYIESSAGVAEGARTGLHSVCVGLLFLAAVFAAPLAALVPAAATSPALILVGFLMCEPLTRINFEDWETAIPAFITLLMLPLTYSIAHGIGYGLLCYVLLKILRLKMHQVHPLMYAGAAMFAAYFALG